MKILIVEAIFYPDIAKMLLQNTVDTLKQKNINYDVISVNGALEVPSVIKMAQDKYDVFIALGCVIRGETTHYDYVCAESCRAIMDLNMAGQIAINGILTVENQQQAVDRASAAGKNKGAYCAMTAIEMLKIKKVLNER